LVSEVEVITYQELMV